MTLERMNERDGFTPVEVTRRLAALGVVVDPVVAWTYLRTRFVAHFPEQRERLAPASLPVDEALLAEWLDEFTDVVEDERRRLSRAMNPARQAGPEQPLPP